MPDQTQQTDYALWGLGLGMAALFVGVGVIAYQGGKVALPYALAYADPELLKKYEAWQAGTPEQRKAMALRAAEEFGAESRRTTVRQQPPLIKDAHGVWRPYNQVMEHRQLEPGWDDDSEAKTLIMPSKSPPLSDMPTIAQWRWAKNDINGLDEIRGRVYGKHGVAEGEHIAVTPVRVRAGIVTTPRSQYRLGTPSKGGQTLDYEAPADSPAWRK